ncbi:MAG: elongation factor P maturation arginine rhamnosyltransferase EarP, partial [Burkholderiaceae bacterium]
SALSEACGNRADDGRMGIFPAGEFDTSRVFLIFAFGYDDAPWGALAQAIERQGLPEGFDRVCFVKPAGVSYSQIEFDAVLQSCDLNFVRGEDSFVRAHYAAAGRWRVPFVWQPYRQEEDAHQQKLQAWQQFILQGNGGLAPPAQLAGAERAGQAQPYWNAWLGVESFFNPLGLSATGGQDAATVGDQRRTSDPGNASAYIAEDDFSVCWALLVAHWATFIPSFSWACQQIVGDRALEDSLLSVYGVSPLLRSDPA